MPQDRFRQILRDYPQGWEVLARHLEDRAAAAEERICLMASETARRRLAVFLLQLLAYDESARTQDDQAQEIPLPLSQTELAGWVGVSRETVERVLREWATDEIVQTRRRCLIVQDILRLEKIADVWRPLPITAG